VTSGEKITIFDALEILKFLAGMSSIIEEGTVAWEAALITSASQSARVPTIFDALEILKYLAGMENVIPKG
jgi:hypothetical protein